MVWGNQSGRIDGAFPRAAALPALGTLQVPKTLTFGSPSEWVSHRAGAPPVLPAASLYRLFPLRAGCCGLGARQEPGQETPQDDPGSRPGRELPGPLNNPRPGPTAGSSPPPRACGGANFQGRRHRREPRLLEPPLPWGWGPQDPHLVAIEEEKL